MAADNVLTGDTGVYYVAFQLSTRGYVVVLTPPNAPLFDLSVVNSKTRKTVSVQVKTSPQAHIAESKKEPPYVHWRINKKLTEALPRGGFFLALVDLRGGPSSPYRNSGPDVYIVPAEKLVPDGEELGWDEVSKNNFWSYIYDSHASEYRDRWDRIDDALA